MKMMWKWLKYYNGHYCESEHAIEHDDERVLDLKKVDLFCEGYVEAGRCGRFLKPVDWEEVVLRSKKWKW